MPEVSGVYSYGQYGYAIYGIGSWTIPETIIFSENLFVTRIPNTNLVESVSFTDVLGIRFLKPEDTRLYINSRSYSDIPIGAIVSSELIGKINTFQPSGLVVSSVPSGYVTSSEIKIIKSTPYFNGVVYTAY